MSFTVKLIYFLKLKLNLNILFLGDIFDFKEEFDFAIGLHACGGLIDIII